MTDDEEFLSEVGDVFGFLIARESRDEEAAMAIIKNCHPADLLLNIADFAIAGVQITAMELGVPTSTVLRMLAMTAQTAGPEILRAGRGEDHGCQ